jgi:hypothetical protein
MRALAEAWPEPEILQSLIAKLPWGHNLRVLDPIKDRPTREWYLRAALEYGWSQDVLVLQIKSRLHEREGKALTNFQRELPGGMATIRHKPRSGELASHLAVLVLLVFPPSATQ